MGVLPLQEQELLRQRLDQALPLQEVLIDPLRLVLQDQRALLRGLHRLLPGLHLLPLGLKRHLESTRLIQVALLEVIQVDQDLLPLRHQGHTVVDRRLDQVAGVRQEAVVVQAALRVLRVDHQVLPADQALLEALPHEDSTTGHSQISQL